MIKQLKYFTIATIGCFFLILSMNASADKKCSDTYCGCCHYSNGTKCNAYNGSGESCTNKDNDEDKVTTCGFYCEAKTTCGDCNTVKK